MVWFYPVQRDPMTCSSARCSQGAEGKLLKSTEPLNSSSPAKDWAPQLGSILLKLTLIRLSLAGSFMSLSEFWVRDHTQNWRCFARVLLWKVLMAPLTGCAASAASILSLADTFDFGSCLHFPEKSMYVSYFWIVYLISCKKGSNSLVPYFQSHYISLSDSSEEQKSLTCLMSSFGWSKDI